MFIKKEIINKKIKKNYIFREKINNGAVAAKLIHTADEIIYYHINY